MSANILDIANDKPGGSVLDRLVGLLGESREGTQSALDSALPSILGGMMQTASTSEGAASLSQIADEADDGLLDSIGELISNNPGMLMALGAPLMEMLFGDKQNGLVVTIARLAGIRSGSVRILLQVVAPLVMSMLGSKKKELSLNTDQFQTMLMDQSEHVAHAMHSDVSQFLGFSSFLNLQDEPSAEDVAPMPSIADVYAPENISAPENICGDDFEKTQPILADQVVQAEPSSADINQMPTSGDVHVAETAPAPESNGKGWLDWFTVTSRTK